MYNVEILIAALTPTCWDTAGYEEEVEEEEGLDFHLEKKWNKKNQICKEYPSDPPSLHLPPASSVHAESQS